MQWYNDDGLLVRSGEDPTTKQPAEVRDNGGVKTLTVDFTYDSLPTFTADLDNDGTLDGFVAGPAFIPEGSYIKSATLVVTEDWATADSADLTIGLYEADGTAVDADGIDVAIEATALDAGDIVECDGALVAANTKLVDANGYVVAAIGTGAFTAGSARLVIEYITPTTLTTA